METYDLMRRFADSWGLLAMFLFFVGAVLWTMRPGSKAIAEDAARIPLDEPAPDAHERRTDDGR